MGNKVILTGFVGKEPEIKYLDSGTALANFSLATTETYKDKKGEKVSDTQWHNIVIWGKLAEIVEKYVNKGTQLYLEGKIKYRNYDDKEGNKKYITEIVCEHMEMIGGKKSGDGKPEDKPSKNDLPEPEETNDQLPF